MADRARLDKITDNMYAQIHRVLHGRTRDPGAERALSGGESAEDVLQDALIALLEYDPANLRTTWEALSVGIARKKAFAALRRATKGRRSDRTAAEDPDDVTVVSIDVAHVDLPDESDEADPERAFERAQQQLVLLRLARERLTDRERQVFFGIHFQGLTRASLAADLGLTSQAVGQMYVRVLRYLYTAARDDPMFPTNNAPTTNAPTPGSPTKGGPRDR